MMRWSLARLISLIRKETSNLLKGVGVFDPPVTFDGLGSVIMANKTIVRRVMYDVEILGWCLMADKIGDIVIDILLSTWVNYPPTASICGDNKPRIINSNKAEGNTAGWATTIIPAGSVLKYKVENVMDITQCVLQLRWRRT